MANPLDMMPIAVTDGPFEYKRDSQTIARAFFEKAKEVRLKEPKGDIPPRAFFITEDHEYVMACEQFLTDSEGKDKLVDLLRMMAEKTSAVAFVFITEAWMAKMDKDEAIDKIIRPSKHPNRVETIMVSAQYQCQKTAIIQAEIVRDKEGNAIKLVEVDIPENDKLTYTGRFCNILGYPSNYKHGVIYCGKKPIEGETEPADAKQLMPGDKVGLYWGITDTALKFFGWAHYEGDHGIQSPFAVHPMTTLEKQDPTPKPYPNLPPPYPCFRREKKGDIIWGAECYWATEDRIKKLSDGKKLINTDIEEFRSAEIRKEMNEAGDIGIRKLEMQLTVELGHVLTALRTKLDTLLDSDKADKVILHALGSVLATLLTTDCSVRTSKGPLESLEIYHDCAKKLEKFINKFLTDFFEDKPPFTVDISSAIPKNVEALKKLKDKFGGTGRI